MQDKIKMRISFFEEFPTKENLKKAEFITWPSTIYVASESLDKFLNTIKSIKNKNLDFVWWPVLEKKEGYWVSILSDRKALNRIFDEIKKSEKMKVKVMLDLELPLKNRFSIKRIIQSFGNRKIFRDMLKMKNTLTCEYHYSNFIDSLLGYNKKYKDKERIKMCYSSFDGFSEEKIMDYSKRGLKIGLGCIDIGILGDERIISPEKIKKEIGICKKCGIKEVIIFRLGGLNEDYASIIKSCF